MSVIGIDLGTTNSLVAVWTDDGPKLIPNALGEMLTPSAVSIDGDDVLVGRAAVDRLITHPDRSVAAFKRFMGTNRRVDLGRRSFRPEELSALVLGSLKRNAEDHLGGPITDAIISVPAYFNDLQRKATLTAARLAGLPAERLINEPTAAALAYGLEQVEEAQFLVFDLGGGTFDVSILDKYDDVMEVRATAGDNALGGNDFRDAIVSEIARRHGLKIDALAPRDRQRLIRSAEEIKVALTARQSVGYALTIGAGEQSGEITRSQFEEIALPLVRRLRLPLERAVADSKIDPAAIRQIVMVGGATRMPMVRGLAGRLFGRLPLTHIDPDQIVALGAAVQAGLKARHASLGDVVMTDVSPYTLGIGALSGVEGQKEMVVVPIIERNSIVPISRSKPFSTVSDNQTALEISVYQGEQLKPENNVLLGSLEIAVPKDRAGQQSIDVRFTYDINGVLEVEVTSVTTQRRERRVFKNNSDLSDVEIEASLRELAGLKVPPAEQEENRVLIARADRIYAELLGGDREVLVQAIAEFKHAIQDAHPGDVARARDQFRGLLNGLDVRPFDQIE